MFREAAPTRGLIISGICLPLALLLGYVLATPDELLSLFWVVLILFLMVLPFLIRHHHTLTIVCWNLPFIAFFLPGKQYVGVVIAGISLLLSILSWTFRKQKELFIPSPATTYPLVFLAMVMFVTMVATGGLHSNIFGSQQWGATRYISIMGAIVAYFAIIAHSISPDRAKMMVSLFLLAGTTWLLFVFFTLIPSLNILLALIPTYALQSGPMSDLGFEIERFVGVTYGVQYLCLFMLMRYGIRGLSDWHHPWRALVFVVAFGLGLYGGFRSWVIFFVILFLVQFYFERLFCISSFLMCLAFGLLAAIFIILYSDQLPLPVQRAISFIPGINLDPVARQSAQETLEWRWGMWGAVLPTVPQYLFLGKGYGFDSTDYFLAQMANSIAAARGIRIDPYDNAFLIIGDYHSGPLTLIIPFGIGGVLAFAAFCRGALRTLYASYQHGAPALKQINTFLLTYFISKLVFYVVFFGSFYQDLIYFVGAVGLSITINGGVKTLFNAPSPSLAETFSKPAKPAGQTA
jgi:hypothetical protein